MNWRAKNVQAMALYLDSQIPGWYRKINLDQLDILSCTQCIMGQLFGHYYNDTSQLSYVSQPFSFGSINALARKWGTSDSRVHRYLKRINKILKIRWANEVNARLELDRHLNNMPSTQNQPHYAGAI